jgi:hypothetical protein
VSVETGDPNRKDEWSLPGRVVESVAKPKLLFVCIDTLVLYQVAQSLMQTAAEMYLQQYIAHNRSELYSLNNRRLLLTVTFCCDFANVGK